MFDEICGHLDFKILGMFPRVRVGLVKPFCKILKYFFRIFSKSSIFDLVAANDRYADSFLSRFTPQGFLTDSVEKI